LVEAMRSYNAESYSMRHAYAAQLHIPGPLFRDLVIWALQSLPDEILVGLDVNADRKNIEEVESAFEGQECVSNLFGGQGYVVKEAHVVNRGDSYSVHHLPEKSGPMICSPDSAVQEQADSHIGCIHIRMHLRFRVEQTQTLHKKQPELI